MCSPLISPVGSLLKGGVRPLALLSPAAALMSGGLTKKKPDQQPSAQPGTLSYGS